MKHTVVVFVHGLFSSSRVWTHFRELIEVDPELSGLDLLDFEYPSPKVNLNPLRSIPDFDVLADSLQTYLETRAAHYSNVILVSHSQGGLIVQRYLARTVMGARGDDLKRIRRVVMFACPNSGSEIFLLARRRAMFWHHPQERELRPINESVGTAQQVVINRVVHAQRIASDQCPVLVHAYAGERDNIVKPASAKGVFPDTGVLPGDHFSIIQPDSTVHRSYLALKKDIIEAISSSALYADRPVAPPPVSPDAHASPDSGNKIIASTASEIPDLSLAAPNEEAVIARWNPASRTLDFILTPETALAWIRNLGEEKSSDD